MFLVNVLRNVLALLVPVAVALSSYLYLYPVFHGCAFPAPKSTLSPFVRTLSSHLLPDVLDYSGGLGTPFRLLALGDPQLEGDTSIPNPNADPFPHLESLLDNALNRNGRRNNPLQRLRSSLHDLVDLTLADFPAYLEGYRKRLDLFGNDYYLAHIYRTLQWWARPTHVSVLGDLLGSQWIDDTEFASRAHRFWDKVFKGGRRLEDELMATPREGEGQISLVLGDDAEAWTQKIINIAGNHDIGYAGELNEHRLSRFEREFGKVNYELRFQLPQKSEMSNNKSQNSEMEELPDSWRSADRKDIPELRIVVLNDMNLDTPVGSSEIQGQTYEFLNRVISSSHHVSRKAYFTLLLTHIPLYKDAGICVDSPLFSFWNDYEHNGGVREQNLLSGDASRSILEGIYGMSGDANVDGQGVGRPGLIINGHDHEGCDTYHYINQTLPEIPFVTNSWNVTNIGSNFSAAVAGKTQEGFPGIREVTLRAMMGDYGGNAGLLSLWFDVESWEWKYEFENCALGTQHIWWATHIVDLIAVVGIVIYVLWTVLISVGLATEGEFHLFSTSGPCRRPTLVVNTRFGSDTKGGLRKRKSAGKLNGTGHVLNGAPLSAVLERPDHDEN